VSSDLGRKSCCSYSDQRYLNRGSILCDIHNGPYQRRSCTYRTQQGMATCLFWLTKLVLSGRLGLWVLFLFHRNSLHLRFSRRICIHVSDLRGTVSLGGRTGTEEALSDRQLDLRMDHVLGMATHDCIPGISWSYHDPISGSTQLPGLSREVPSVAWYTDILVHHHAWCDCQRGLREMAAQA